MHISYLLSRKVLQRILGALWLIDGLLQLQPSMFTMNMVNGVMKPMLDGQPGWLEPSLQFIVAQTTTHLAAANWLIIVVQILLGLAFLLLPNRSIKPVVLASIVWALIVWYGGEGLSMLLTGQASVLTGAPGAVLLYPLLGLAIWPRHNPTDPEGLLSREQLRWILAGFWIFAALLQLQPYWWQTGQISQAIGAMVGAGGFNTVLVDPVLQPISSATAALEIPLNIALIVIFAGLGISLALLPDKRVRPFLVISLVISLIFWYLTQGFGMILSGMATDFNSGLLVVLMALAVWPTTSAFHVARMQLTQEKQAKETSKRPVSQ